MQAIRVLNHTGDTRIQVTPENMEQTRHMFHELVKNRKHIALRKDGKRADNFDQVDEDTTIFPHLRAG
jgi:hypothetical protein